MGDHPTHHTMKQLFFAFCLFTLSAQAQYTLNGAAHGTDSGWAVLSYFPDGEHLKEDSVRISHGSFTFHGPLTEPARASLNINGHVNVFYLDRTTITIYPGKEMLVLGSPAQDEDAQFLALMEPIKAAERNAYYHNTTPSDTKWWAAIKNYFQAHPSSYILLHELLETFVSDMTADQFNEINQLMTDTLRTSYVGKIFSKAVQAAQNTAIGQTAPPIAMKDIHGKNWSLTNFHGKYLLIDFWASWCPPCRIQNKAVVAAYKKYKSKGFDVMGFSLDYNKAAWIKAVATDGLPYTQLSDLECWNSPVRKAYGLYVLPKNFLLDETGKIIAKDLSGDELQRKLATLL